MGELLSRASIEDIQRHVPRRRLALLQTLAAEHGMLVTAISRDEGIVSQSDALVDENSWARFEVIIERYDGTHSSHATKIGLSNTEMDVAVERGLKRLLLLSEFVTLR